MTKGRLNVMDTNFMTVEQVRKALGISKSSVYKLVNSKDFPTFRIGRKICVPTDKFDEWVEGKANEKMNEKPLDGDRTGAESMIAVEDHPVKGCMADQEDGSVRTILLKQLQLLQEESEKARQSANVYDRARSLAVLSEAMTKISLAAYIWSEESTLSEEDIRKMML